MLELVVGALIGTAAGTGITVWVCRHTLATITERRDLAAVDLAQAEVEGATAARTAAFTEQVMAGIARDLDVIRWHHADQARVRAEQVGYHRYLVGYHDHMRAWEDRLTPVAEPAPPVSVAELRSTFAALTGGGGIEGLPVVGPSVYDRLGRSTVVYAPADPELLAEPEPEHHVSEVWTDEVQALLADAEHGPVQHDALVDALTGGTGELPTIDTDETADGPDVEPQGPAPTVPVVGPATETGYLRDWIAQAIRPRPVPSPLVIGRSVRDLMRQQEETRLDALMAEVEIPELVLAGAR